MKLQMFIKSVVLERFNRYILILMFLYNLIVKKINYFNFLNIIYDKSDFRVL